MLPIQLLAYPEISKKALLPKNLRIFYAFCENAAENFRFDEHIHNNNN
jgi:hypothetical protein